MIRALSGDALQATDCQVDDHVEIALPEAVVLRGSIVVYALPIASMLLAVGLVPAFVSGAGDAASLVAALTGFTIGLGLVRWHAWLHQDDPQMQPVLQRRLAGSAGDSIAVAAVP